MGITQSTWGVLIPFSGPTHSCPLPPSPAAMPYQSVYAPHYSHYNPQTNRPAAPPAAKPKKKQVSFGGATIIMYREPQQYQAPSQSKRREASLPAPSKREPVRYETLSRRPKHAVYEGGGEHVEHVGRR